MSFKEYGGCLWLDRNSAVGDYYKDYIDQRIEVDSGRSGLQWIIEQEQCQRIWLPVYNCPLVVERIKKTSSIEILLYNLNEDFFPDVKTEDLQKDDVLLWVNYCGIMCKDLIDRIARIQEQSEAHIIIDNIPAFFSQPRMDVYNLYSCRKFIGVPDGGYVIKAGIKPQILPTYDTAENYLYLLKAIEKGSNDAYDGYLKSESRFITENQVYGMPKLTKYILNGIDYESIKKRRKENFITLHKLLNIKNNLGLDIETDTPSVYPYLTSSDKLRQRLLDNQIYISRFWKHVLSNDKANKFEKYLAEFLIPLPIDQRYSENDMLALGERVLSLELR